MQEVFTGQKYELKEIGDFDNHWVTYSAKLYKHSTDSSALYRVILTATLRASQDSFVQPYLAVDDIQ